MSGRIWVDGRGRWYRWKETVGGGGKAEDSLKPDKRGPFHLAPAVVWAQCSEQEGWAREGTELSTKKGLKSEGLWWDSSSFKKAKEKKEEKEQELEEEEGGERRKEGRRKGKKGRKLV